MLMRIDAEGAGVALNDVFTNVQNVFSASAGVTVTGPVAERTQWETMINGMMALLVGLIAVAVLIALVGVANTLSLSVIERTRESATLRAIGMTRGQLRRSLAVEALLLSLVSGVVGVVLGTCSAGSDPTWCLVCTATPVFPFEWATNGVVLGVAALAALLASVAPARRAVKRHQLKPWPKRRAISSLIRGSFFCYTSPLSYAKTTACTRSRALILARICATWVLTVGREIKSLSAIS